MKQKTTYLIFFLLSHLFISAQTVNITDSLSKNLIEKLNISKTKTSNINWERIAIPDGKELRSFEVTPNNELYIGCNNGGVFKHIGETWELIGLESNTIYDFEMYPENKILFCTNDLYLWDDTELIMLSESFYPNIKNTFGFFFGYNSFSSLYRSLDGGLNWEEVYYIPQGQGETIKAIIATTPDSIFMGTTKYTGNGGGVYLSVDGGDNWNPFGLSQHFIAALAVDNYNQVYAGNSGHYVTGQGGLYRYNYGTINWDTLFYYPWIQTIVFNSENHIFVGYELSNMTDIGGVMHSEDSGATWIIDTTGMGSTWVTELQMDNNGFMYALTGYTTKKLYRTTLPVNINENACNQNNYSKCYPNPAYKYVNILFNKSLTITNDLHLVLYNIEGKTIIKKQISKLEMEKGIVNLDVTHLEKGCYFYNIYGLNYKTSNKFIKQ